MTRIITHGLLALVLLILSARCLPAASGDPKPSDSDATLEAWLDDVMGTAQAQATQEAGRETVSTPPPVFTAQVSLEQRIANLEERVRQLEQSLQWIQESSHNHGGFDGGYGGYGMTGHDHTHPPDHTHYGY